MKVPYWQGDCPNTRRAAQQWKGAVRQRREFARNLCGGQALEPQNGSSEKPADRDLATAAVLLASFC